MHKKPTLEQILLAAAAVLLAVTQSWPAVVAFIGSGALYYMVQNRGDKIANLQSEMNIIQHKVQELNWDLERAEKAAAQRLSEVQGLEARVVILENTNSLAGGMSTQSRF